uniref:Uncharacterized protein n=1 Tax=Trypanosoma congolense (strain IL3000) TaxID=1068625 RepID=G0UUM7_TRYCI|nr:conserved hypothetical protein [Trypanosoma congolense IL3000]
MMFTMTGALSESHIDALIRDDEQRRSRRPPEVMSQCRVESQQAEEDSLPQLNPEGMLSGLPCEALSLDDEAMLLEEYKKQRESSKSSFTVCTSRNATLPPPYYSGPVLTLSTKGPYTRFEVLSTLPPVRPNFDAKKKREESRSKYYPRPVRQKFSEQGEEGKTRSSLWLWKRSMGLLREDEESNVVS